MKAVDIALKDMRQSFRNKGAIIFMFVMPIMITTLFYFMFGGIANEDDGFSLPQTAVILVNLDEGNLPEIGSMGQLISDSLHDEQLADLLTVTDMADAAAAKTAVDQQEAGIAIIIPPGFSDALTHNSPPSTVELYNDPTLTLGPAIVSSIVTRMVDGMVATNIGIEVTVAQLAETGLPVSGELIEEVVASFTASAPSATQSQTNQLTVVQPPANQTQTSELTQIVSNILGGMMIFYAFFTGTSVLNTILTEEEEGTLQRLFTTPTPQLTIFSGKFLAALLVLTVQVTILLLFGWLVFGITWGKISAIAIAAIGLIIISATTGLFLVSLLKSTRQASLIFGGLLTLTGMLGLFSVFTAGAETPPILETVSLFVPQGWAMRGLTQAMNGRSLTDMLFTLLIVLLWSAVFFWIGQRRLARRFA